MRNQLPTTVTIIADHQTKQSFITRNLGFPVTSSSPKYRIVEAYLYNTCNMKCGYCNLAEQGHVLNAKELQPFRDVAYIDQVTDFFNKRTTDSEKWHLTLTGGEPLLMPNFHRFCSNLFSRGNIASLYTALMVDAKHPSFQTLLEFGAPHFDYLMTSFHPEAESQEDSFFERVRLLKEAGHRVIFRYVGHPARLQPLDRLAGKCEELDICFYPTALFSDNYPGAYTADEKEKLSNHFTGLSQIIQIQGGIDTNFSECHAGNRIIAVHFPTGDIWPCISVQTPVLGNIYKDTLTLYSRPIACPKAGIACICDVHFQQDIVAGTEDSLRFAKIKAGYVKPMSTSDQLALMQERKLKFSALQDKGFGKVSDDKILIYPKSYVKEQFEKNYAVSNSARSDGKNGASGAAQQVEELKQQVQNQAAEIAHLRNVLHLIENSKGWRLLNKYRTMRDRLFARAKSVSVEPPR